MTKTSRWILLLLLLMALTPAQAADLSAAETSGERRPLKTTIVKALTFEVASSTTVYDHTERDTLSPPNVVN
ncbi:hypothetical protein EDC35_101293 [Thiobaca trueperi]|uniref:Uncharacterized protein n=1 Tax=Thiobaca trueperi TaxID=127458 RepID=A0A4R3N767_9GAMM|nr:hypothetical protein EDC35_101293 [Thiobaca trueperi]